MQFECVYKLITEAVKYLQNDFLLKNIEQVYMSNEVEILKNTQLTILLEGLYQSTETSSLKNRLLEIRAQRWHAHFGIPTVEFLLSYETLINMITNLCKTQMYLPMESFFAGLVQNLDQDEFNNVLVNSNLVKNKLVPEQEKLGVIVKTFNPTGGFTTVPSDYYSKKFLNYIKDHSQKECKVLELGAGFGAATLQALAYGATVFCNDIEPKNLAVVQQRYENNILNDGGINGIKKKKLILLPASFPEELKMLPKQYFDAILVCRLLHFFPGKKIEQGLSLLVDYLKPGGKLFIVCETPYLKNWQTFVPVYEERQNSGEEWPGEIPNPRDFETSGRSNFLPVFVHWITKDILDRTIFRNEDLELEQSSYIDRRESFPQDLLLDGRESVGAIAIKNQIKRSSK